MANNQPVAKALDIAAHAGRNLILIRAGNAFGEWLANEQMTPARLRRALEAGEPILKLALGQIPVAEVAKYRGGVAAKVAQGIAEEHFSLVLKQAAMNKAAADCANLLLTDSRLYWNHFVPAMKAVRAWFIDGTPL